jgi:hypothetical protein
MATPHVAGAAAVLLSAKPDLSVADVFGALEASAAPMADGTPFWETGFGYVDTAAAVRLAQSGDIVGELAADRARLMASRSWTVQSSDLWTWDALPVTVGGADTKTIDVPIAAGIDAVKVALSHPSLATVGVNGFEYDVSVRDASGEIVGTGVESSAAGTVTVLIDKHVDPGTWTVQVDGIIGVADPDTIDSDSAAGTMTTLQVAQLHAQTPATGGIVTAATSHPGGALPFSLVGDDGATLPIPSPEGCEIEDGAPSGTLSATAPAKDAACQSGATGWTVSRTAEMSATFTSEPIASGALVGGPSKLVAYVVDDVAAVSSAAFTGYLAWTLSAVPKGDAAEPIALGEGQVDAAAGRNEVTLDVPVGTVPPGARIVLTLAYSSEPAGAPTNAARIVYGGGDYADSSFTLTTGSMA